MTIKERALVGFILVLSFVGIFAEVYTSLLQASS